MSRCHYSEDICNSVRLNIAQLKGALQFSGSNYEIGPLLPILTELNRERCRDPGKVLEFQYNLLVISNRSVRIWLIVRMCPILKKTFYFAGRVSLYLSADWNG